MRNIPTTVAEQIFSAVSTPFYVVCVLLEMIISNWQKKTYYTTRDTTTNLILTSLNLGLDLLFRAGYIAILVWFYNRSIFTIENKILYWVALVIIEDFAYFLLHVCDHYCRLFWAVHVTHHSSNLFNLTTGIRSSVFEPLYRFIFFIPIAFLGFQPMDIVLIYSITQMYGALIHTKYFKSWGILDYILVTPSHHRVHHGSNPEYLDKNMGMLLIIWDRMFGTFQKELDNVEIKFGLTKDIEDKSIVNTITHEWRAIIHDLKQQIPFKAKLKYLLFPPGWSHDGSRKTSNQIREELGIK
ncbi:MAG: sterol desaturase family protein [Saprospiraceae bacterium]|nr:sterol desaturase family protein [Saprospiraceae bacterium]